MPFEGLARQTEIEHLPRSRTPSITSQRIASDFLSKRGTVLSQKSIPEQRLRELPEPIIDPVPAQVAGPSIHLSPSASSAATAVEPSSNQPKAQFSEKQTNGPKDVEKAGPSLSQRLSKRISMRDAEKDHHDDYEIILKGNEHLDPHLWKESYRWFLTGLVGLLVLNATFASSAPSNLIPSFEAYFGFSQEIGTLTIAIFVAGYCFGPLLWGPLSEQYGRRNIFIVSFIPYIGFQVGCALSKNTASILIFRALSGIFASSPLTNSGGVIADMWGPDKRGIALAIFSLMPFAGPSIAPIVSGAMQVTHTNWRWIFWTLTIFAGVCLAILVLLLPETYIPYILHKEAKKRRKETGDQRWWAELEHPGKTEGVRAVLDRTILKPFKMIFEEPMLAVLTVYMGFVYGVMLFEAYPITFGQLKGLNALKVGLCFLTLPVGGLSAVLIYIFYYNRKYMRKHHELNGKMVPPEQRLLPLMPSSILFAFAFFMFGWTSYSSISLWPDLIAATFLGIAILFIFLGIFNYLIDSYLKNAASALAINTVVRSAFGAGFPLFATQMFNKLGVPGASSLLGGLAICFIPAPFILFRYGPAIRRMSKNAIVIE